MHIQEILHLKCNDLEEEYDEEGIPYGRPLPKPEDFSVISALVIFSYILLLTTVMMLVQSLSQLAAMYGNNGAVTIRDNTDNIVYLGGNDLETADQIARRINKPVDEVLALPIGQEYLFRRGQKPLQMKRYQIYDDPLYRQEILPNDMTKLK